MPNPDAESMLLMAARLRQAFGLAEADNWTMRDAARMLDQIATAQRADARADARQADQPAVPVRLDAWIESEFSGNGVAVRTKEEPPIPGEPLMSMAVAKDLTRRAVATFDRSPAMTPEQLAFQTELLFLFTPWAR